MSHYTVVYGKGKKERYMKARLDCLLKENKLLVHTRPTTKRVQVWLVQTSVDGVEMFWIRRTWVRRVWWSSAITIFIIITIFILQIMFILLI